MDKRPCGTAGSFPLHKGTGDARIAGGRGIKYPAAVGLLVMSQTELSADDVLAQFDAPDHIDADDVPEPIMNVARYIVENTGLTGDYNDGVVQFADGGDTIQWYPRSRSFSSHDDLLTWVQTEADGVLFGVVTSRNHPETDESTGYIEIHETSRWVRE